MVLHFLCWMTLFESQMDWPDQTDLKSENEPHIGWRINQAPWKKLRERASEKWRARRNERESQREREIDRNRYRQRHKQRQRRRERGGETERWRESETER
jgi:hypothetical protein